MDTELRNRIITLITKCHDDHTSIKDLQQTIKYLGDICKTASRQMVCLEEKVKIRSISYESADEFKNIFRNLRKKSNENGCYQEIIRDMDLQKAMNNDDYVEEMLYKFQSNKTLVNETAKKFMRVSNSNTINDSNFNSSYKLLQTNDKLSINSTRTKEMEEIEIFPNNQEIKGSTAMREIPSKKNMDRTPLKNVTNMTNSTTYTISNDHLDHSINYD
jgi:hypothetical protein